MVRNRGSMLQRHRRKFVFLGFSITTLFAAGSISLYLLKRWLRQQQLRIKEQHFAQEQIRRRFVQTQEDALYTVAALIPVFALVLERDYNLDTLLADLRRKRNLEPNKTAVGLDVTNEATLKESRTIDDSQCNQTQPSVHARNEDTKQTKANLWNEFKHKSIVKLLSSLYLTCTLLLLTRIQLNILTRREYIDTATRRAVQQQQDKSDSVWWWWSWSWPQSVKDNSTTPIYLENENEKFSTEYTTSQITQANERAFLSLSWWLINKGHAQLSIFIEKHIQEQFGSLTPKSEISTTDFKGLLLDCVNGINSDLSGTVLQGICLPEESTRHSVLEQTLEPETLRMLQDTDILTQLHRETLQCLGSRASHIVLTSLVECGMEWLSERIEQGVEHRKRKGTPMALYAMSCKDCYELATTSVPQGVPELVGILNNVPALEELSSSVYSSFEGTN